MAPVLNVSICMPTVGSVRDLTAVCLARLVASVVDRKVANTTIDLVSGCQAVAWARNTLVARALASSADAILFIDHDMTFPADALERLIARDVDVCGALYNKREARFNCVGRLVDGQRSIESSGIAEADELGAGMLFVRTRVFRAVQAPWFQFTNEAAELCDENPFGDVTEDINFVRRCRSAGIKVWADLDLSMQMGHIGARVIGWQRSDGVFPTVVERDTP